MEFEEWKSQLKRGILEYCILLLIEKKPRYGYDLISEIGHWSAISAKEGTVYPLLRRLQKEGHLIAQWSEAKEGLPPRKYYTMTQSGHNILAHMDKQWFSLVNAISHLHEGGE